jgi:hypothetical protein
MGNQLLRFFWPGPGRWILFILAGLGVAYYIGKYQTHQRTPEVNPSHRPVAKPNNDPKVDPAYAQKQTVLADRPVELPERPTVNRPSAARAEAPERLRLAPKPALFIYEAPPVPPPAPARAAEPVKSRMPEDPLVWLPAGTKIPCRTSGSLESGSLDAPLTGIVDTDVEQRCGDRLYPKVIPAQTLVSCWASPQAVRNRVGLSGIWLMTFADGRSIKFPGVALCRQEDAAHHLGLEDATPGVLGQVVVTDPAAQGKALLALLATSILSAGQTAAGAALQAAHSSGFYQVPDTTPILAKYLDQMLNGRTGGDATYVYVPSSTQFYVVPSVTIYPNSRTPDGAMQGNAKGVEAEPAPQEPQPLSLNGQAAMEAALHQAQTETPAQNTNHEAQSRLHY